MEFLRRSVDAKYLMRQTAVFKFPGHPKVNLASTVDLVTTVCHATVVTLL